MVEYGYIDESGYLVSREIEEYTEQRMVEGEIVKITVSVEEQLQALPSEWKPVLPVDQEKVIFDDYQCTRPMPYDAGDCIDYRYEKIPDAQKLKKEIQELKGDLSAGDYKITKCYEAFLLGQELPYNVAELHSTRQDIREKINELEAILTTRI